MANNRKHNLFKTYPITGRAESSRGLLPTPYHVYDGMVTFVAGTASLEGVSDLLQSENVLPMQTTKGRALMGMWICEFTEASLAPHNELQFSFFVSEEQTKPVPNNPFILLRELVLNPNIRMLVHGIWNNTETAIAYNNDVLKLGARMIRGGADYKRKSMNFLFNDVAQGSLVASGKFAVNGSTSIIDSASLFSLLGVGGMMRFNSQPFMMTQAMNRISPNISMNFTSQTYTVADKLVLQRFNKKTDKLSINQQPYSLLEFRPKFIEHMLGFKFVYLNPHNRADASL